MTGTCNHPITRFGLCQVCKCVISVSMLKEIQQHDPDSCPACIHSEPEELATFTETGKEYTVPVNWQCDKRNGSCILVRDDQPCSDFEKRGIDLLGTSR